MPVTGLEQIFQRILSDGKRFGSVGQYEEIRGKLNFEIDPLNLANTGITDVDLAPRNEEGKVVFDSDISIIRPVDLSKVSGKLLLDVVNRGNRVALPNFNMGTRPVIDSDTPVDVEVDLGDGLLMEMGYVVVACGWQLDAPPHEALITMRGPEALDPSGSRLKDRVYMQLQSPEDTHNFLLSDKSHKPYKAYDLNEPNALVEIRDMPDGPAETMPRDDWRFGRIDSNGEYHPDPAYICSSEGFKKGRLYQVTYTALGAPVIGLSFAALRDCVSWFKYGSSSLDSPVPGIQKSYAYGRSQTGRFLRTFVHNDFNLDESSKIYIQRGKNGYGLREDLTMPAGNMFRDELEIFGDACRSGTAEQLTAHDGNVAVAMVYSALKSIEKGSQVVISSDRAPANLDKIQARIN